MSSHKGQASSFLDNLGHCGDPAALNALQKCGGLRYGGDGGLVIKDGEKCQGHGFIAKGAIQSALQPSHAVEHIGTNRHKKLGSAVPEKAYLNSHQQEEGVGIPSSPRDLFDVAHMINSMHLDDDSVSQPSIARLKSELF